MPRYLTAVVLFALSPRAFADQCAWVTRPVADKAAALLRTGETLQEICRPCGDTKAKPLVIANAVVARATDPKYYEVRVNGRGLDLAYVFVRNKSDWLNLGLTVKCGVAVQDTKLKLEPKDLSAP